MRTSGRFLALLAALAAVCGCGHDAAPAPTNVILLSIDTLRADHLGCYGYDRPTSPALDALAAAGVVFEDAVSPAPWTLPAHASLLTGRYPSRHGARRADARVSADAVTLAETLTARGLQTAAFVNAAALSERSGLNRGFGSFVVVPERVRSTDPSTVWDAAMMWLTKSREQPFFMFVHTSDIGSDYGAMADYERQFARPYDGTVAGTRAQLMAFRRGQLSLGAADAGRLVDLYDAGIRQTDDGLARFLRMVRRLKVFDATLIVVTADHGEEFLEHGGVLHGRTLFQEVVRVPLIVGGPGVPPGRRVTETVSLVDVAPTILGALGIAPPSGTDGIDLAPSWRQPGVRGLPARPVFTETDGNEGGNAETIPAVSLRAVRDGRLKLIADRAREQTALFDLVVDPGEQTNIAGERPEAVRSLRQKLDAFMGEHPPR